MLNHKRRSFLTASGTATLSAAAFGLIAGVPRRSLAMLALACGKKVRASRE